MPLMCTHLDIFMVVLGQGELMLGGTHVSTRPFAKLYFQKHSKEKRSCFTVGQGTGLIMTKLLDVDSSYLSPMLPTGHTALSG